MRKVHGVLALVALALACSGAEVAQPAIDDEIGKLHNEALAWVLADLQAEKVRLGFAWSPDQHLRPEAERSMARFLDRHPEVNRSIYHQMKDQLLVGGPLTAPPIHELSSEGQEAARSVGKYSELYWTAEGPEWGKLIGMQAFPSAMRQKRSAAEQIVWADVYGAIGGFAAGGPAGAVAGAIACSLGTALGILIGSYISPPAVSGVAL